MSDPEALGRKLIRARMELVLGHPFFGAMALRLLPRPDSGCVDLWTDGETLGYNPAALAHRDEEAIAAMLAHEILHLACEHHLRRKGRDATLWNKACDLAINGLLVEAGFRLPAGYAFDPAHAGSPAEAIYAVLAGRHEERRGGGGAGESKTEASPADTAPGGGGGDTPFAGRARDPQAAPPGADLSDAKKQRQSAAGDKAAEQQNSQNRTDLPGEVRDHPELAGDDSERKRQELAAKVRQDVNQSLRAASDMGRLPAALARRLGEPARPRLDWATLLRRFILARAISDYSWSPPNRRHIHMDLYLPSPRSMILGDVALAIDTSGSVDERLFRAFCSELSAILEACDTRLLVYFCDAAAGEALVMVRNDPPPALAPKGGGGTDYRPVFAKVEADGLTPACLIYLTDLECDRYPAEPPYPVLWAVPGTARSRPPFGEVLHLPR